MSISNVAIEAEVVDAANLLICFYFSHYNICVFLICPFFPQQLIQIDSLQSANFCSVLYKLVKVPLLGQLSFFTFLSERDSSLLTCEDAFLTFLFVVLCGHMADIFEYFGA